MNLSCPGKSTCFIIPSYNAFDSLPDCLDSLLNQTCKDFEILVIDDCSTDDPAGFIQKYSSDVRIIRNSKRCGPEKSRNNAIKNTTAPYLAFLDADARIDKDWLQNISKAIKSDNLTGMCASKILSPDNIIENAGHGLYYDFSCLHRANNADHRHCNKNAEVFGVCFAAALVKREVFDKAGMFDEDYGLNFGDDEWSWRARLVGYKCIYAADAIAYHKKTRTKELTSKMLFIWEKNRIFSIIKYYPLRMAIASLYYTLKRFAAALLINNRGNSGLSLIKIMCTIVCAWGYALSKAPCFLKKRPYFLVQLKDSTLRMDLWIIKKWH